MHYQAIYLARQPIFDRARRVLGYELLFRSGQEQNAVFTDGNQATSRVLMNAFIEMDLDTLTHRKLAFVNLTRDFVTGKMPMPVRSRRLVLEILEDVAADPETLEGLKKLKRQGYLIALDDFILSRDNIALLPFANIIKVDILSMGPEQLKTHVNTLQQYPVKLLAEKVEDMATYEYCRALGFDYFQGYFFSQPALIQSREIPPNQLAMLEIIARLQSPNCSMAVIEDIVRRDVAMSYKILRVINSSYYGLNRKVDSVKHALLFLGVRTLQGWLTLFSMAMLSRKPAELINLALQRARMCELLSRRRYQCSPESAFTVGLFSLLDVMMDRPLEQLLARMPFSPEVSQALLRRSGQLGEILDITISYEQADWANLEEAPVSTQELKKIFLETLQWTHETSRQLRDGLS